MDYENPRIQHVALNFGKQVDNERTAVERVNSYLKQYFQLNNVCHRIGRKAKLHFNLVTFFYNTSKLALDCLNTLLQTQAA